MSRQRVVLAILFALIVGVFSACSSSDSPTSNSNATSGHLPGEYGYTRGTQPVRHTISLLSSGYGMAVVYPNRVTGFPNGLSLLSVQLETITSVGSNLQTEALQLSIPFLTPTAGSFSIGDEEAPLLASIVLSIDSVEYKSVPGGSLQVTLFDTVNNVVSGTFECDLAISAPVAGRPSTIHISSGYFEQIPIAVGSYGQGTISASIDGSPFSAHEGVSAYVSGYSTAMTVIAAASNGQLMQMMIAKPGVGTFPLSRVTDPNSNSIAIFNGTNSYQSTSGTLHITAYDPTHRRFSANFQFIGKTSDSSGAPINVTNGMIDNVQWYRMY